MNMGQGGVGLGLGAKKYQVVFLFAKPEQFEHFVNSGWEADASASAAAGTSGAGAASTFKNGVAIYQFTEKGLVAQADVSGTKYWKAKDLN
jgi:lipid-binding SYLF domain-containing protein